MNTTTKTFVVTALIALTAIGGAIGTVVGHTDTAAKQEVVKLERVVIVAKRADAASQLAKVEQLPRVVIEGRRADAASVQVAAAKLCDAQTLC